MRLKARIDANQPEIVTALRSAGATVQPLHQMGAGCPDLLVGFRGQNFLLEVKDGAQPPSARRLTPIEANWIGTWRGWVFIVKNVSEALTAIGAI